MSTDSQSRNEGRHELKFVVPVSLADQIFDSIAPFVTRDPHAGIAGSYEIASIYYDTHDLRFYWDREESVGFRRKVRLRSYNVGGDSVACFLEIKEKHRNLIRKKRTTIDASDLLRSCDRHDRIPIRAVLNAQAGDNAVAEEVTHLDSILQLQPTVIVRYVRRSMLALADPDIRITLDTNLTTGGSSLSRRSEDEKYFLSPNLAILEIKVNRCLPWWLHGVIQKFGLARVKYSKYCEALSIEAAQGLSKDSWFRAS